jgi:segregation and condensation protein B
MAKRPPITNDPQLLKPVIEALIFASEDPLAPRAVVRLLTGDDESSEEVQSSSEDISDQTDDSADETSEVEQDDDEPVADDEESDDEESEGDDAVDDDEQSQQNLSELTGAFRRVTRRRRLKHIDVKLIRGLVEELNIEYEDAGRAFRIVEVAGGYQFATVREFGEYVAMLSRDKSRRRLSPAALETLAIIAYRQPVSKPEIESIRGVNCDQVLLSLLEKSLVMITGRADSVGRPLLYGTSEEFLRSFGLRTISDLPKLREIEELMEEDAHSPEQAPVITVDEQMSVEEIEERVGAAGEHWGEQPGDDSGDDDGASDDRGDGGGGDAVEVSGDDGDEQQEMEQPDEAQQQEPESSRYEDDEDRDEENNHVDEYQQTTH